ncbi:hypothetical protein [Bartonella sp. TT29SHDZB]|uniref:hypothetical protein n=1 Tax=Bartonella sp. TT29SHDZB TaxID=3243581 RepID=UPI0035D0ED43
MCWRGVLGAYGDVWWGMCWDACVEGVGLLPKSLLFIEGFAAAALMSACQEHGKWRLGERRRGRKEEGEKGRRREKEGMQEGERICL